MVSPAHGGTHAPGQGGQGPFGDHLWLDITVLGRAHIEKNLRGQGDLPVLPRHRPGGGLHPRPPHPALFPWAASAPTIRARVPRFRACSPAARSPAGTLHGFNWPGGQLGGGDSGGGHAGGRVRRRLLRLPRWPDPDLQRPGPGLAPGAGPPGPPASGAGPGGRHRHPPGHGAGDDQPGRPLPQRTGPGGGGDGTAEPAGPRPPAGGAQPPPRRQLGFRSWPTGCLEC